MAQFWHVLDGEPCLDNLRLRHYGLYRVLKPREPLVPAVPAITYGSLPASPRSEPEELSGGFRMSGEC